MRFLYYLKKPSLIAVIVGGVCLGNIIIFLLIPYLFDIQLAHRLLNKLPLSDNELSLSRVTPWKIRGTIRLGSESEPTLVVPRFDLHFHPSGLFDKKIEKLIIDSASIHLVVNNGKIGIRGFDTNPLSSGQKESSFLPVLPLAVESIVVKNCLVTLHLPQGKSKMFVIHSHFRLSYENSSDGKILRKITSDTKLTGALTSTAKFEIVDASQNYNINASMQFPELQQVEDLIPGNRKLSVSGALSLESALTLSSSFNISNLKLSARLSRFNTDLPGITLYSVDKITPITFSAKGEDITTLDFYLKGMRFKARDQQDGGMETKGVITPADKSFTSNTKLMFDTIKASAFLAISGSWQQQEPQVNYLFSSQEFTYKNQYSISPITLKGKMEVLGNEFTTEIDGRIQTIFDKKNDLSANDISFHTQLHFPPAPKPTELGFLKIDRIKYRGVKSGDLNAKFSQSSTGLVLDYQFSNLLNSHISAQCRATVKTNMDFDTVCNLPETQLDSTSFTDFFPLPDELSFSGNIKADAQFSITNKVPTGRLVAELDHGSLVFGENSLSEIELSVELPKLPNLYSRPSQLGSIGSIQLGDIHFSDAQFLFRMEDDQAVFLEKGKVDWCGGRLETAAIKFHKEMETLTATLYGDRLGFSELMDQFGIKNTEGEGSLNGKIPIEISRQGLVFEDGFLFSTPGTGGIIRFHDTEQLRQGIPGLDRTGYLDYSMKALENFSYNWTKLTFNNQNTDLLIAMQLDGKPAEPLPFGYKKGHIVKTTKGVGLQHPIRLDVNFRLPLQDLFQYGKNIQSIMENM